MIFLEEPGPLSPAVTAWQGGGASAKKQCALGANWPDYLVGQPLKPVRVLLVDDDPCIRHVIAQELLADPRIELAGQAGSLREGKRLLASHDFDVLIVDIRLGDGSGFDLITSARNHRSAAEIIVVSALEDERQLLHAFALGATGYLVKNSWFQSFAQAVLQVVNGGAAITPSLARRLLLNLDPVHDTAQPPLQPQPGGELSGREREVLQLVAAGHLSDEIATRLSISSQTVHAHIKNIYRKLHVHTRAQAVSFALRRGLV